MPTTITPTDPSTYINTVAGGRCECTSQCGNHHGDRCPTRDGPDPATGALNVLLMAHRDRDRSNNDPTNLLAVCSGCHPGVYTTPHRGWWS